MKKRISILILALLATTLLVSVTDVKAAESGSSIRAADHSQYMACGKDKCGGCDKKDECDKEKEGCGAPGEKKGGCGKKAGCGK